MKIRTALAGSASMTPIERSMGRLMRAPDHGAGDPPPTDDGGDPPADPPAGDPPARPDFVPEKFWDAEKNEVRLEGLAKSYGELEKLRGKSPDELRDELFEEFKTERLANRPESADKYALPDHDGIDAEALAASPIVKLWRDVAFENGADQEAFNKVIVDYVEGEIAAINDRYTAEMGKLGDDAKARTEAASLWAGKVFKGEELEAVQSIASTAAGVTALEKIMGLLKDVDLGGNDSEEEKPGDMTLEDARALMAKPEYWDPKRRDPAVVKKVEGFFQSQHAKA